MALLKIRQAWCALADGRLDEACELVRLSGVREHRQGQKLVGELTRGYLERGRGHLAAGRPRDALVDCAKALNLAGNTLEVAALREEAGKAFGECGVRNAECGMERRPEVSGIPHSALRIPHSSHMPDTLLLQIDGIGSFLVVTRDEVTLGAAGGSPRPDVALVADPGTPRVSLRRVDEDYFCELPRRTLLHDGARIELSSRCVVKFRRPNPASTSAVLELSGSRLAGCDARRVILLDRELVIGPSMAAHVVAPRLRETLVVQRRGERLVGGVCGQAPVELPAATHTRMGPVSLVWTEARP